MNNQNMKLNSAKTVVREHISTLNHLNEIPPPPLPPTLITTSINNGNSSPPTSQGSNKNNNNNTTTMAMKNVPWKDKVYLKNLFDACECIGYALEKDSQILIKEQILVQCLVNILRQIVQPNYSNNNNNNNSNNNIENNSNINSGRYDDLANKLNKMSIDEDGNDVRSTMKHVPLLLKSWVFGSNYTPKICFSIIECITFMTEHEEYDEMLLCSNIVDVLSLLAKYSIIERSIESIFNPFPEKIEDVELETEKIEDVELETNSSSTMDNNESKYLITTDSLYGILDSIKDLSASDEIESYLTGAGIIDVISPLLTYYPMDSEIITVSMLALANLTTNAKLHKNSKSHRACIKPTVQILINEKSSRKAKECATAVLRNFSADSRTKLTVANYDGIQGLLYVLQNYKFNNKKAKQQQEKEEEENEKKEKDATKRSTSNDENTKKTVKYLSVVTKRDAIGALRNLSTHDDCDEDIVKYGGIDFFITNMAEIINKYENKNEFRDSLESCISSIRNICVTEEVALQFINHPIGLKLLASVIIDDKYPYICRGDAVKAMENLALYVTADVIMKFVESKSIESLITILEIDLEDDTISESAVVTLGYLVVFEIGKSTIVKLGGRTMVTMLNMNRKHKAEAEKDKRVTTSPVNKNHDDNREAKQKKKENKLGFGGKSSRFGEAFINDLERRKK